MFSGITQKTTTTEIAAKDELVSKDIASYTETLHDELIDMNNAIGISSETESGLLDN